MTKAARLLGVHPNTVRAWSDAGRLRYYRINPRGDRRYRVGDLQRFLTAAEGGNSEAASYTTAAARRAAERAPVEVIDAALARGMAMTDPDRVTAAADRELDLGLLVELGRVAGTASGTDAALTEAVRQIREHGPFSAVIAFELRGERLVPRATTTSSLHLVELPRNFGALGDALDAALRGDARSINAAPAVRVLGPRRLRAASKQREASSAASRACRLSKPRRTG